MNQEVNEIQRTAQTVSMSGVQTELQAQKNPIDEAYRLINLTSFQQNFNFLIGHYKKSEQLETI